jgi:hypothetical protein
MPRALSRVSRGNGEGTLTRGAFAGEWAAESSLQGEGSLTSADNNSVDLRDAGRPVLDGWGYQLRLGISNGHAELAPAWWGCIDIDTRRQQPVIDRHSSPLIRVIRAHERMPDRCIVRLSAPSLALCGSLTDIACAFLETWRERWTLPALLSPGPPSVPRLVPLPSRASDTKAFALGRAKSRFYAAATK